METESNFVEYFITLLHINALYSCAAIVNQKAIISESSNFQLIKPEHEMHHALVASFAKSIVINHSDTRTTHFKFIKYFHFVKVGRLFFHTSNFHMFTSRDK